MTRREEIEAAAKDIFKDSEYPVPNIYSFIRGAEWADRNPSPEWHKFTDSDCKPKKRTGNNPCNNQHGVQDSLLSISPLRPDDSLFWQ